MANVGHSKGKMDTNEFTMQLLLPAGEGYTIHVCGDVRYRWKEKGDMKAKKM